MGREALIAELAACRPHDDAESDALRRMVEFVSRHADCFSRSLSIGHMTAGAWLVDESGNRALLTHHKKLNRWLQLGGHADGCVDLRTVALNEAREESGIDSLEFVNDDILDVDVHRIPARPDESAHDHYDVRFLLRVIGDPSFCVSEESHALAWFAPEDLGKLDIDESVRRLATKWQSWLGSQNRGTPFVPDRA